MENRLKSKTLSLEELISEINSNPNGDLSIEKFLELFFQIYTLYIDYYESDLGEFLNAKLFANYYLYISLRIILIFGYLITLSLFAFLAVSSLSAIFGIIAFVTLFVIIFVDEIINKKFRYTNSFFHSKGKKLKLFKTNLDLILNNSYLSDRYSSDEFDVEMIKTKSIKLENRIENDNSIIPSYSYYIKKFELPSILLAPLITFFISLIYNPIQNPLQFKLVELIDFLLGLSILVLMLIPIIIWIIKVKKARKRGDIPIYVFYEFTIIAILEAIRLKLRIIQFPKEERYKELLLKEMKNIIEELKKAPPQN